MDETMIEQWTANFADQADIAAEVLEEQWQHVDDQAALVLLALGPLAVDGRYLGEFDPKRAVKAILAAGYSNITLGVIIGAGPWASASRQLANGGTATHRVYALSHDHGEALARLAGVCEGDPTAASVMHYRRPA